ncbi:MAG: cysteine dioxygenase family protein [Acidobacteriota bacterium]
MNSAPITSIPAASDFQGCEELVRRLDHAVSLGSVEEITAGVKETLTDLLTDQVVCLPLETLAPEGNSYARRLLYRSEEYGYVVIAMVWGVEQGTPLHDHDGVWCVEGVLQGEIEVTRYEALGQEGERWNFRQDDTIAAHIGESGTLIPPFDYHTIANRLDDKTAVTIHVYGRELEQASIFEPEGQGWYRRVVRQLSYN